MSKVILNRHRNTGILVKETPKYAYAVLMEASTLTITKFTWDQLRQDWTVLPGYPVLRAIHIYLNHWGGLTKAAKESLEAAWKAHQEKR